MGRRLVERRDLPDGVLLKEAPLRGLFRAPPPVRRRKNLVEGRAAVSDGMVLREGPRSTGFTVAATDS